MARRQPWTSWAAATRRATARSGRPVLLQCDGGLERHVGARCRRLQAEVEPVGEAVGEQLQEVAHAAGEGGSLGPGGRRVRVLEGELGLLADELGGGVQGVGAAQRGVPGDDESHDHRLAQPCGHLEGGELLYRLADAAQGEFGVEEVPVEEFGGVGVGGDLGLGEAAVDGDRGDVEPSAGCAACGGRRCVVGVRVEGGAGGVGDPAGLDDEGALRTQQVLARHRVAEHQAGEEDRGGRHQGDDEQLAAEVQRDVGHHADHEGVEQHHAGEQGEGAEAGEEERRRQGHHHQASSPAPGPGAARRRRAGRRSTESASTGWRAPAGTGCSRRPRRRSSGPSCRRPSCRAWRAGPARRTSRSRPPAR